MKFPFTSVEDLIDQVKSELKTFNQQGNISTDDCYMWAVDIARELAIGEDGLDNETVFLTIRNRSGKLPLDFYLAKEIWLCKPAELTYSTRTLGPTEEVIDWKKTSLLRPGDSQTMRLCAKDFYNPGISPNDHSYTMRVPPGVIRTSFQNGVVQLTYYRTRVDDNGVVMIPDEVNCKKAVVNYLKYKLLEEKYIMQEIPRYIYKDIEQNYQDALRAAQQIIKFDNPADAHFDAVRQSQRYRRFKL